MLTQINRDNTKHYAKNYGREPFLNSTKSDLLGKQGKTFKIESPDRLFINYIPLWKRVEEIVVLLVLDKIRRKFGFDTSVLSLQVCVQYRIQKRHICEES